MCALGPALSVGWGFHLFTAEHGSTVWRDPSPGDGCLGRPTFCCCKPNAEHVRTLAHRPLGGRVSWLDPT